MYSLITNLPKQWTKNADPMVNDFPLVNNDIWILGVFLLSNFFFRLLVDATGTKKALEQRTNGYRFIYHCFLGGLCGASFAIGFLITDWNTLWFTCQKFPTFSTFGFSGKIKMWMVYFAFLGKVTILNEWIWRKSMWGTAVGFLELGFTLYGLKFDATPAIWLVGGVNIWYGLYTHYWNGIEITKTETPENIRVWRRRMTLFFLTTEFITAYAQVFFTLFKCSTDVFPLHYTILPLFYPLFAAVVYPKIYVDAFSPPTTTSTSKKIE